MQKLVFFLQSNDTNCELGSNIGKLYMNRFTIDEDSGHEIVKINEIEKLRKLRYENVFSDEDQELIGMGPNWQASSSLKDTVTIFKFL